MEDKILTLYLEEYGKLKDEQTSRIGFRDNLLYVTLGAFGAIISFSITEKINLYALLTIPWICLILGWTYLINDEKISAIGRYIRSDLSQKIILMLNQGEEALIFGWESTHQKDKHRLRRKLFQLIIDELTFVFSGLGAIAAFVLLQPNHHPTIFAVLLIESFFLIYLGIEILIYASIRNKSS